MFDYHSHSYHLEPKDRIEAEKPAEAIELWKDPATWNATLKVERRLKDGTDVSLRLSGIRVEHLPVIEQLATTLRTMKAQAELRNAAPIGPDTRLPLTDPAGVTP